VLRLAQSTLLRSTYTLLAIRDGIESDRRPVLVCPLPPGALPRATATAYTRSLSLWVLRVIDVTMSGMAGFSEFAAVTRNTQTVYLAQSACLSIIACSLVTLTGHSCLSFVLRL
jgi:hypothetical protein